MDAQSKPPRLTVFYNTHCPVCDAGIRDQRRRLMALVRSGAVVFEDINQGPDALARFDIDVEAIRKKLHALDDREDLLIGAEVAIAMWTITPGLTWLGHLAGNPIIRPISKKVYDVLAHFLYRWNKRRGHW